MPCPHRSSSGSTDEDDEGSRRAFMKAAVSIGGVSALSACLERAGREADPATPQFPRGTDDPDALPDRQHAWSEYLWRDRQNVVVFPRHQAFVFVDYVGEAVERERDTVESAFRTLERAYQRGAGHNPDAGETNGLLFTIGYSPRYFDRFDGSLPEGLDLPPTEDLLRAVDEDPSLADPYDAVIHIASDRAGILLAAEEALFGELDAVNGVTVDDSLAGIFERRDRRTGFVGRGLPSKNLENDDVPERAPISMGFKSNYRDGFPSEDAMTIQSGPFAGGTTQHVSRLRIDLPEWYEEDHRDRVEKMFSPHHNPEQTGEVGDFLGGDSGVTQEMGDRTVEDARSKGRVGHGQKLVRAREDDTPIIMRRGDFNSAVNPDSALHFGSIQRGFSDFIETRKAMNDVGFGTDDGDVPSIPEREDGILHYIETTNRANFLMPPRRLRALPTPRPG